MADESFTGPGWLCECGVYISPDDRDPRWKTHFPGGEHIDALNRSRKDDVDGGE